MAMETKTRLSEPTIDALQELICINIDARDGFNEAAEKVEEVTLAALFRELAVQRTDQASELRAIVSANGQDAAKEGSYAAAAHRAWMDLRAALGGGTAAVLSEAERGEDHIKAKYEEVMNSLQGGAARDVLQRHYAAVKQAHDRVRDLRDEYQNQS